MWIRHRACFVLGILLGCATVVPAGADDFQANLDHAMQTLNSIEQLLNSIEQRHRAVQAGLAAPLPETPRTVTDNPGSAAAQGNPAVAPGFSFVNLTPFANQNLADNQDNIPGNNLQNVPRGEQKLGVSQFFIGDQLLHLRGKNRSEFPRRIDGIPLNSRVTHLHFLHSAIHGGGKSPLPDGTEIGAYIVHYADGTNARIPLRYGEDLRDWWDSDAPTPRRVEVMWTGTNLAADQRQHKIRVFVDVWNNPRPEKQATTLDYVSDGTVCEPFLVALSVER